MQTLTPRFRTISESPSLEVAVADAARCGDTTSPPHVLTPEGSRFAMLSLTQLIEEVRTGDRGARDRLFESAYPELRKLARSRLREGGRNTFLETTAIVHEAYLRFANSSELGLADRRAFFAYASQVMRSVIVDSVREHRALRRGGDLKRVDVDTQELTRMASDGSDVLHIHEALFALEKAEPRLASVVEMRYFGGYSEIEIAGVLGLTERTVRRDWDKARLILQAALSA